MYRLVSLLAFTTTVLAIVVPDGFTGVPNTGSMQVIPLTAKASGSFSNGKDPLLAEPENTLNQVPDVYGAREIDIPIGRYFHGHLNFYPTMNDATKNTGAWGSDKDSAEDSACGIPANSYFISGVAIHPYFLKYAGLDRYCMQDVCIWFWKEDGSSDMLLKVTDICTPDSVDGVPCLDPMDIKIDRTKAGIIMNNLKEPVPSGNQYPDKVWWLFTKCSFDGLAQPAYINNSNWFTDPYLPNNDQWVQYTATQQYINNQKAYPGKGWNTYPPGLCNISRYAQPITDWDPLNPPSWSPLAGGKGSSLTNSSCSWPLSESSSSTSSTAWEMIVAQETPQTQSTTHVPTPSSQFLAMTGHPTEACETTKIVNATSQSSQSVTSSPTKSSESVASTMVATLTAVPLPSSAPISKAMLTAALVSTATVYVCGTTTMY